MVKQFICVPCRNVELVTRVHNFLRHLCSQSFQAFPDCTARWKYIFDFSYYYMDTSVLSMACAPYLIMFKQQRPTWKVSGNQHCGEDGSLHGKTEWGMGYAVLLICWISSHYAGTRIEIYLQFSPGIELAQALHSLLPMHHWGHCRPLLNSKIKKLKYQFDHQWNYLK